MHPQWLVLRSRDETFEWIARHAHGRVLDIGCGDRNLGKRLPEGCDYLGIDFPPTVAMGYPGRPDVFADAHDLPFMATSMDTVAALDVLEHLITPERALSEAWRVLRPRGCLIVQIPFLYPLHDEPHDFGRWTAHGLLESFGRNGFAIKELTYHGQPVETACALLSIGIAKAMIDAVARRHPTALLLPLAPLAIVIVNILGWTGSVLLPASDMMPMGYRIVGIKRS